MEEEEELIKQRLTKKVNDCLVLVDCGTNELTSKLHEGLAKAAGVVS